MLWEALQAMGVNFNVSDRVDVGHADNESTTLTTKRTVLQHSLETISQSPNLRLRLRSNGTAAQIPLERLVGLFQCTQRFKPLWQESLRKYHQQADVTAAFPPLSRVGSSLGPSIGVVVSIESSSESHSQVSSSVPSSFSSLALSRQGRLSDGSSSSKSDDSLFWNYSSTGSSNAESDKEN